MKFSWRGLLKVLKDAILGYGIGVVTSQTDVHSALLGVAATVISAVANMIDPAKK